MNDLILVTEQDEPLGRMEKLQVHQKGLLHRAFSVFIVNDKMEMLLQQRAYKKYHSPSLWTNACCSHPTSIETDIASQANIRLQEEMGFTTGLQTIFSFTYRADFDNGLTEHEYDHVLLGTYNGEVFPNKDEVMDYTFMSLADIEASLASHPSKYTVWFALAFPKVKEHLLVYEK